MYEAMQQPRFESFFNQLVDEKQERIMSFAPELMDCFLDKEFHDCVESDERVRYVTIMKSMLQRHQASLEHLPFGVCTLK